LYVQKATLDKTNHTYQTKYLAKFTNCSQVLFTTSKPGDLMVVTHSVGKDSQLLTYYGDENPTQQPEPLSLGKYQPRALDTFESDVWMCDRHGVLKQFVW